MPNTTCHETDPNAFKMLREIDDDYMPWLGFLLGQTPGSIWYWCADQVRLNDFQLSCRKKDNDKDLQILLVFSVRVKCLTMILVFSVFKDCVKHYNGDRLQDDYSSQIVKYCMPPNRDRNEQCMQHLFMNFKNPVIWIILTYMYLSELKYDSHTLEVLINTKHKCNK